jgi:MoxR-like ATPase
MKKQHDSKLFPTAGNRLPSDASSTALQQAITAVSDKLFDKPQQIKLAFACLLAEGHLLIEDRPGLGKTTLALAMAQVLGLDHKRIQFTSDMLPSDVLGVSIYHREAEKFVFHKGPVFTQLLLADELNRGTPRTQSALLEAMAERQVSIDGKTWPLAKPFFVIGTQNPLDESGTFPLPDSQLDRFSLSISLGYPERSAEKRLYDPAYLQAMKAPLPPVLSSDQLRAAQQMASRVHADDSIVEYLQDLVAGTRNHPDVLTGLSPRAGLALFRVAQALASIDGRDFLVPEDVQQAFVPVARHRLGSLSGQHNGEQLAGQVLQQTAVR